MDDPHEVRARDLLTLAAETIEVGSGPIAVSPRRPVWPWGVAAAAVVLLVIALPALFLAGPGTPPDPAPAPSGPVTVPQTLWMTQDQATQTLEDAGLDVDVHREMSCLPSERVLRTQPRVGREIGAGEDVTIVVTAPADLAFCADPSPGAERLAMQLLDLARFGSTNLVFAPSVSVVTDSGARTLTADQAADPDAWGTASPLTDLRDWVLDTGRVTTTVDRGDQYACGARTPFSDRRSVVVTLDEPGDGVAVACRWVRIYTDAEGRVDAVTSEQQPGYGTIDEEAVPGEPTRQQRRVADAFAAYARGGAAPPFASEVRLLLGNRLVSSVDDADPLPVGRWRLRCDDYGEASCPIDALLPLRKDEPYAVTTTEPATSDACHLVDGELPADLTSPDALARSVTLSAPEPDSCALAWELQLWLDDDGAIYAANFVAGMP